MIVVGSGAVELGFAHFTAMGTDGTVVEFMPTLFLLR
jgi:hypothetical protein